MSAPVMECGMCGVRFEENRGQPTCQSCPLAKACRYVRCPHCGYENPIIPEWLTRLQELVGAGAPSNGPRSGDAGS